MTVLPEGEDALLDLVLLQVSGLLMECGELLSCLAQEDPRLRCRLRRTCHECSNQVVGNTPAWTGPGFGVEHRNRGCVIVLRFQARGILSLI